MYLVGPGGARSWLTILGVSVKVCSRKKRIASESVNSDKVD